MANLKELRLRISTVKNTRKITAAMSQIAAARLRKAQNSVLAATPYAVRMKEVVSQLVATIPELERSSAHPLLAPRKVKRTALIVLTADRGLCGGFNSNINRAAERYAAEERRAGRQVVFTTIGRKGTAYFTHKRETLGGRTFLGPTLANVVDMSKRLSHRAIEAYLAPRAAEGDNPDRVDRVVLVYNRFVSVLSQEVTFQQLVPLAPGEATPGRLEPTYEPNRAVILEHLVPVAIESLIQYAMFNSIAAEIAARRVAMDAATDNASELIADLTLHYNRERQASITKELMEIIGGAEALRG